MPEHKIKRDAFIYLDPKGKKEVFSQCESCMMWTGKNGNTCTIHGKEKKVTGDMSCGLYVHGPNHTDMIGKEMSAVTPKESGLYKGDVRCENCISYHNPDSTCMLYEELDENDDNDYFELDVKVNEYGCCNAFRPQ